MDAFITHILETFRIDAERATRVFPPEAKVILSFCDRVANDVVGEYVQSLLGQARIVSQDIFLQATAATFVQSWKLVDLVLDVTDSIPRTLVEDVIYRMFETNMDEYLDEETEWVKRVLEGICRQWEETSEIRGSGHAVDGGPTFLSAANPDQVKRNVLAGFKDVLLLPVTIVPRTVTYGVNAIGTVGSHAVSGLAMLHPQKWTARPVETTEKGEVVVIAEKEEPVFDEKVDEIDNLPVSERKDSAFDKLQLLVSLDIALELIHGDRDALKRTETFANYPGKYGHRVRETIEEIFILMLKAAGDRHIAPGFRV
jgi:recyclin-1